LKRKMFKIQIYWFVQKRFRDIFRDSKNNYSVAYPQKKLFSGLPLWMGPWSSSSLWVARCFIPTGRTEPAGFGTGLPVRSSPVGNR
jgi:hypothetical protein